MSLLRPAELTQEWAMQEGMLSAQLSLTMSAWLCDSLPFNLTPLTRGPHSGVVNLVVSHTLNSSPTASTAGHSGRGLLGGDAGGGGMLLPPSLHLSACHIGTRLATSCMSGEADCSGTCVASCLLSMSWTEASTSRVQVL